MGMIGNVIVRVGADVNRLRNDLRTAQNTLRNFQRSVAAMVGITSIGLFGKAAIEDAMAYEAALQQVNRIMGENAKQFVDWSNTQAGALNMSRLEAVKYGAVFGNLISGFAKDSKQATDYTMQLLKASSIVASATGRDMTDVMERIRSGLLGNTESIEDLGINVNIAMIESTNAFKRFAGDKSWQQLDFQTQQQIRLFAILEQSSRKYGDSVSQNTRSSLQQFISIMRNVQLNIGLAFMPILNVVIPILTSFATALERVTKTFAQFVSVIFGSNKAQTDTAKTAKNAAKAQNNLEKATKDAGATAKGSVAGFDEVNDVQEKIAANAEAAADAVESSSTSGTSTEGAGLAGLIPQGVMDAVDALKQKFAPLYEDIRIIGQFLYDTFNPGWEKLKGIIGDIAITALDSAFLLLKGTLEILAGLIKGDWDKVWRGFSDIFKAFKPLIDGVNTSLEELKTKGKKVFDEYITHNETLQKHKNLILAVAGAITLFFLPALIRSGVQALISGVIFTGYFISALVKMAAQAVITGVTMTISLIRTVIKYGVEGWKAVASIVAQGAAWIASRAVMIANQAAILALNVATKLLTATQWLLNAALAANPFVLVGLAVVAFAGVIVYLWNTNEDFRAAIINAWNKIKVVGTETWAKVTEATQSFTYWLIEKGIPFVNFAMDSTSWAFGMIADVASGIWNDISDTFKKGINTVIGYVNGFIDKINSMKITIPGIGGKPDTTIGFDIDRIEELQLSNGTSFDSAWAKNLREAKTLQQYMNESKLSDADKQAINGSSLLSKIEKNLSGDMLAGISQKLGELGADLKSMLPSLSQIQTVGNNLLPSLSDIPTAEGDNMTSDDMISAISTAVMQALQINQGGQTDKPVVINIDSTQLARVMIPAIDKESQRTGNYAIIQGI